MKTESIKMEELVRKLIDDLDAIGFSDPYTPISGSSCIDVVATHLDALRKTVPPIVKKKFTLLISMYTDDVMIEYLDHLYCYYRNSLEISEQFDSLDDIVTFIDIHIYVHDDYKASGMAQKWLADCVASIKQAGIPASDSSGNQKYSMRIITNK